MTGLEHVVVLEMTLTTDQFEELDTFLDDHSIVPTRYDRTLVEPFNPHGNTTSDGVLITRGMRVIDYDRRETTVVEDRDWQDWKCCGRHARRNDLQTDYFDDCKPACSHDHWYTLENGSMMNGSRMQSIR